MKAYIYWLDALYSSSSHWAIRFKGALILRTQSSRQTFEFSQLQRLQLTSQSRTPQRHDSRVPGILMEVTQFALLLYAPAPLQFFKQQSCSR